MFSNSIISFFSSRHFSLRATAHCLHLRIPVISLGGFSGVPESLQIFFFFVWDFNPLRGSFPSRSFNVLNLSSCNIYFKSLCFVVSAFWWGNPFKCRSYGMFSAINHCWPNSSSFSLGLWRGKWASSAISLALFSTNTKNSLKKARYLWFTLLQIIRI